MVATQDHAICPNPERFMASQARRDPRALRRALDGALALIATYRSAS